ncbi:MAG: T9SS type A sorting domain-containing protein [Ignavibacteria bacterium]|nr:T9SS type A sorting domain-containing protein [Ignavibacteria bacterium]
MDRRRRKSTKGFTALLLSVGLLVHTSVNAQSWEDGMYRSGMHQMGWGGQLPVMVVTGKAIVDSSSVRSVMGVMMGRAYYLDTLGNGSRSLQLFFGPYWYEPTTGAKRPLNGQTVTVKGGKMSQFSPLMLVVYEINAKKWRDSVGAPAWSGRWMNRSIIDSVRIYCPTDSLSYMGFARGFMGSGMMGGGMMWPDSLFGEFEQMHPDSLPGMTRGRSVMGFHMDAYNPQGAMMMQGGAQGHGGMGFQSGVRMRFRVHPDSLRIRGLVMSQMTLLYLDTDNQWKTAAGQTIDPTSSSISIASTNVYSYYALASSAATAVQDQVEGIPTGFSLGQNYPNPFNPSTTITFSIAQKGLATLKVYNSLGEQVASLVSQQLEPGTYNAQWNASNIASGVYLYRLEMNGLVLARKMLVVK